MERHHPKLEPTRDHFMPESRGGKEIVICCLQCNMIKADMLPAQWIAFMERNPGWWLLDKLAIRAARRIVGTPGIQHRSPFGIHGRRRSPRKPVIIVPPELIWRRDALIAATIEQDARLRAPETATHAVPGADGQWTPRLQ
jgi:hypothetical protein